VGLCFGGLSRYKQSCSTNDRRILPFCRSSRLPRPGINLSRPSACSGVGLRASVLLGQVKTRVGVSGADGPPRHMGMQLGVVGGVSAATVPPPPPPRRTDPPPQAVAVQDKSLHRGEVVETGVAAASAADRAALYASAMDYVLSEGISGRWCTKYGELLAWHRNRGTCSVPKSQGQLGRWVARQRELHKRDELEPARERALNLLGIVWDTNETQWELRVQQLLEYKRVHGTACVPIADGELGAWTAKQRQLHAKGRLLQARHARLADLGFVFNMPGNDWEAQFARLCEWKAKHGHTRVPFVAGELGWWVNTQRQADRKGRLLPTRKAKLDTIDFCFFPQERGRPLGAPVTGPFGLLTADRGLDAGSKASVSTHPHGSLGAAAARGLGAGLGDFGGGGRGGGYLSPASVAVARPRAATTGGICKKRKADGVSSAVGALARHAAGALPGAIHPGVAPPCVATVPRYGSSVAGGGLDVAPPPHAPLGGALPVLAAAGPPPGLGRATTDGATLVTAAAAGGAPPWGGVPPLASAVVEPPAAGGVHGHPQDVSWHAAAAGGGPVALAPMHGGWPGAPPIPSAPLLFRRDVPLLQQPLGATALTAAAAPLSPAGPLAQQLPSTFAAGVAGVLPPRSPPLLRPAGGDPPPREAPAVAPPSPSDALFRRARSPVPSESSSDVSWRAINQACHRAGAAPPPPPTWVPPLPSTFASPSCVRPAPAGAAASVPASAPSAHTASTGCVSPPVDGRNAAPRALPSLPPLPASTLRAWADGGSLPPLSPPLAWGLGVPSPSGSGGRPTTKLPPFSSLLSCARGRASAAPPGLTASTVADGGWSTEGEAPAGRVGDWLAASTAVRGFDAVAPASGGCVVGDVWSRAPGGVDAAVLTRRAPAVVSTHL